MTSRDEFIEQFGLIFEQSGIPRMAGRVFGRLLIADPPHQNMTELQEDLQASKSSISSMTRLLIEMGLLEQISLPGERQRHYQVVSGGWEKLFMRRLMMVRAVLELLDEGKELVSQQPPESQLRLHEMHELYAFMAHELPLLMEKWRKQHERGDPDAAHG
jgi:DNA-binding transcriptional regulator GbsR (MarR family)